MSNAIAEQFVIDLSLCPKSYINVLIRPYLIVNGIPHDWIWGEYHHFSILPTENESIGLLRLAMIPRLEP